LKEARKLSSSVLNPFIIEDDSLELAITDFLPIYTRGLLYAEDGNKPEWKKNSRFHHIIILKVWNVSNVKHFCKGKQKIDISMDHFCPSRAWKHLERIRRVPQVMGQAGRLDT
jgi:hypothetical protein